jgi:hypothetical protein
MEGGFVVLRGRLVHNVSFSQCWENSSGNQNSRNE